MRYKTYCFALQKRRFYKVKAALLPSKRAAFAMSNRNYYFSSELSLQNQSKFSVFALHYKEEINPLQWFYCFAFCLNFSAWLRISSVSSK